MTDIKCPGFMLVNSKALAVLHDFLLPAISDPAQTSFAAIDSNEQSPGRWFEAMLKLIINKLFPPYVINPKAKQCWWRQSPARYRQIVVGFSNESSHSCNILHKKDNINQCLSIGYSFRE